MNFAHVAQANHDPGVDVSISTDQDASEHGTVVERDDWKTVTITCDVGGGSYTVMEHDDIHDPEHHEHVSLTFSDSKSLTSMDVERGSGRI